MSHDCNDDCNNSNSSRTKLDISPEYSQLSMQEMLSVVAIGRVSAGSGGDFHRDSISHAFASRVEVECSRRSSATMAARAMNGVRTLVRQFSANHALPLILPPVDVSLGLECEHVACYVVLRVGGLMWLLPRIQWSTTCLARSAHCWVRRTWKTAEADVLAMERSMQACLKPEGEGSSKKGREKVPRRQHPTVRDETF